MARMQCFGDFTAGEEKCDTCNENADCFVKVYSQLPCFLNAMNSEGRCEHDDNDGVSCSEEYEKCRKIRFFLNDKKTTDCLGEIDQTSDDCLLCPSYKACDVYHVMLSNLGVTIKDIEDSIEEQISEFQMAEDSCYGKFDFDPECYSSQCEFVIHCRKASLVVPGVDCNYWKPGVEIEYEEKNPCILRDKEGLVCKSADRCITILVQLHEEGEKRDFKMRLYKGFLSLEQIREAAEVEDG